MSRDDFFPPPMAFFSSWVGKKPPIAAATRPSRSVYITAVGSRCHCRAFGQPVPPSAPVPSPIASDGTVPASSSACAQATSSSSRVTISSTEVPCRRASATSTSRLIPWNAHPQQHQPNRLRQHRRRLVAERILDHRLLPQPHRRRDHLLAADSHADRRRTRYNDPIVNVPLQVFLGHPEQIRRGREGEARTEAEEDATDLGGGGIRHANAPFLVSHRIRTTRSFVKGSTSL